MSNKTPQGEHWKAFALFLEKAMNAQGMNRTQLAEKVGVHSSTIKRFFELEFCVKFDVVLKMVHALQLNIFFESQDESAELNKWFEDAMDQLGRRPDKLSKN
ncbi:MAG: helix-turn-helix transcriptional regulator [Flavobacteriaceae bacterium]|nr:helix-turn-helix transcriptional regulator [Flavobacteriaceae bacterium]